MNAKGELIFYLLAIGYLSVILDLIIDLLKPGIKETLITNVISVCILKLTLIVLYARR
jgi:hypothetical protein